MKKILYIFLATLTFWSCSDEKLDNPGCTDCSNEEGAVKLMLKFPGRTTIAPKTYAGSYPADIVEKSIADVRIFVFSDDGNGSPKTLLISEPVKAQTGDTEVGVTATFFMRKFGDLHLVAVANVDFNQDGIQKMLGESFDEFSKTLVTQSAGVANEFAMCSDIVSANIPDPQTATTVPSLSFLLERLSARIDIENETTATAGEFVLEGARLVSAIDRSFLVKGQTPALTIGNTTYDALAIPARDWKNNTGVNGDKKKMYMQLYAYENVSNTLVVQVHGTYKGKVAQFDLPFGVKEVKRNTRYVVKIQNVAGNRVTFSVNVVDWEAGGDIVIKPGLDGSAPKVTKIEGADASGNTAVDAHSLVYNNGATPNDANMITLTKPSLYHTKITVESPQTEATLLVSRAEVPWVSIKELGKGNITNGKLIQTFLVTYAATQDLYERTAELELQNKFSPDKINRHLITIKQPKATTTNNHLARFANANVGDLNQFAHVITPDNLTDYDNLGKYYQWGRNVAFDYTSTLSITTTRSNGNDALLWSADYIATPNAPLTWMSTDLGGTWGEVVAKATNAPVTYTGTNGGDPCPTGYRLPEKEEFVGVLNYWDPSNINFTGNVNKKDVEETIKIKGISAAYKADYYSTSPNVVYALKMKGAGNKNLTAYRYEYKGAKGLWITSRLLGVVGSTTKVEEIAKDSFWENSEEGGGDVIRYFPSLGIRDIDGKSLSRRIHFNVWSSVAFNNEYAWYLGDSHVAVYHKSTAFSLRPIRKE